MTENVKIKITDPEHLMDFGEWIGYAKALEALKKVVIGDKLPGFNYAVAKIETLEARARAQNAGRNLRLVVKTGHDLDAFNVLWKGADEIELEPIDVAKSPSAVSDHT